MADNIRSFCLSKAMLQRAGAGQHYGSYNRHPGAGTRHGRGGGVPPAAGDSADNVQRLDAASEPPNCLHLLCHRPYVSCFLGRSGGKFRW